MRYLIKFLLLTVVVLFGSGSAWSSEADELRAKAKSVQREAETLAKEGRKEEAEKLFREVKELLVAADKREDKSHRPSEREIDELHQRLKAISEKEEHAEKAKNKEALVELRKHRAEVERALSEHREHHGRRFGTMHSEKHAPELPEPLQHAARRLKHLHAAIENLRAAEMHDLADDLSKKAEHMERELHRSKEQFTKEHESDARRAHFNHERPHFDPERRHAELERRFAPGHATVEELRHEMQRLRAELNELREEIKKRP